MPSPVILKIEEEGRDHTIAKLCSAVLHFRKMGGGGGGVSK